MTMPHEYDIVVVGGGPAGSVAATEAARGGAQVLIVDRSTRIGDPVRCGELIRSRSLEAFLPEPGPWVVNRFDSYRIVVPSGTAVRYHDPAGACLLDRRIFDQELLARAVSASASVATETCVSGLLWRGDRVVGIVAERGGERVEIGARIVIGTDGVGSRVARFAGINSTLGMKQMAATAFAVARHPRFAQQCELHFGSALAPGGYVWVFAKGDGTANVGAGVAGAFLGDSTAAAYLRAFLDRRYPGAGHEPLRAGGIPISMPLPKMTGPGVMLAGDAARQVNPLTGAGIHTAMLAGRLCGLVAAQSIQAGDQSGEALSEYERLWREKTGEFHRRSYRARRTLDTLSDEQLDEGAACLDGVAEADSVAGAIMRLIERAHAAAAKATAAAL